MNDNVNVIYLLQEYILFMFMIYELILFFVMRCNKYLFGMLSHRLFLEIYFIISTVEIYILLQYTNSLS